MARRSRGTQSGSQSPVSTSPVTDQPPAINHRPSPIREPIVVLRNRVLGGLFLALPLVVTILVIKWVYDVLSTNLITPIAQLVLKWWFPGKGADAADPLPWWVTNVIAPLIAITLLLSLLFLLGMFFRSRLHRLMDWVMLQVPVVRTIYSAVVKVIDSLQRSSNGKPQFQRVVLINFPHFGLRAPGFVTSTCIDRLTGKKILCVYAPTTPVPTSGYMMLIPEEAVIDISWDVQETVQAIVSGGLSLPEYVEFFRDQADLEQFQAYPYK